MDKRENWIDSIKVLACTLILVGHLVQGLQRTGILVRNGKFAFFLWFIYLFHVQLFFLCSGYLHEKKDKAGSLRDWLHYIGYKFVALLPDENVDRAAVHRPVFSDLVLEEPLVGLLDILWQVGIEDK